MKKLIVLVAIAAAPALFAQEKKAEAKQKVEQRVDKNETLKKEELKKAELKAQVVEEKKATPTKSVLSAEATERKKQEQAAEKSTKTAASIKD